MASGAGELLWYWDYGSIMCGRYTQQQTTAIIEKMCGVEKVIADVSTSFNIAPGQDVAVVAGHKERRLGKLRWGLPVEGGGGRPLINARAETLASKPTFAPLLEKRRCLVVADGYYEWQQVEGRKQPVYIHMRDHSPFVFAGLWSSRLGDDGQSQACCVIITTAPNDLLASVHQRMPAILPAAVMDAWLDPKCRNARSLLQPYCADAMSWHRVSDAVNSVRNNSAALIEPV